MPIGGTMKLSDFFERLQKELLDSGKYPAHENNFHMPGTNPWTEEVDFIAHENLYEIHFMGIVNGRLRVELKRLWLK